MTGRRGPDDVPNALGFLSLILAADLALRVADFVLRLCSR